MPGSRLGPGRGFGRATQRDTSKYIPTKYIHGSLVSAVCSLPVWCLRVYIWALLWGGGLDCYLRASISGSSLVKQNKKTKQDAAVTADRRRGHRGNITPPASAKAHGVTGAEDADFAEVRLAGSWSPWAVACTEGTE